MMSDLILLFLSSSPEFMKLKITFLPLFVLASYMTTTYVRGGSFSVAGIINSISSLSLIFVS